MGETRYAFGPFVLRPGHELLRDGKPLQLGHRALLLLEALLDAGGEVVSKTQLMDRAWPGLTVEEGNLTVQVAALRKELGERPGGQDWIVTVPRVGYRLPKVEAVDAETSTIGGRPTLAVLPFVNLSGDSSRDYFADGVVEDVITALSRFKTLSVVSRNSSFVYKGRAADARQVARDLGVRYLLEGSVRLAGERVRVTVQLVDATAGTHLWASTFDGDLGQIFEFQDRITESVVGLVEPQIRRVEIERARRRWPDSPQAYDHFLRALPHFYSRDPQGYRTALAELDAAIELEPDYALAHAYASWAISRGRLLALKAVAADEVALALDYARAALTFGDDDPLVLATCAHTQITLGNMRAEGIITARRALRINPHHVTVLVLVGICNMLAGDLDEAETCYRRAWELSPGAMEAYESLAGIGFARFFKGDFASAVEWLEQSRATLVDWPPTYWMLIASYAHLGRLDDARTLLDRLLEIAPGTSLASMATIAHRFEARYALMRDGLVAAGLR